MGRSRTFGRISMRGRMTVLIGSAMAPLAIFIGISVTSDYDTTLNAARREVLQAAALAAARQAQVFSVSRIVLDTIRRTSGITTLGDAGCQGRLGRIKDANPQFLSVGVIDANGMIVCHNMLVQRDKFRDQDFVRRVMDGPAEFVVSNLIVSRVLARPTIVVAMPIPDEFGKASGMVFAALDLDYLSARAESLSEGGRRVVALVQPSTGRILTYHPASDFESGTRFENSPLLAAMRRSGSGGVTEAEGLSGDERIFGFEPIEGAETGDLVIAIGESRKALLDPIFARAVRSAVAGTLALTIALLASWWLADRLQFRPILRLTRAARRIGSGDFRVRAQMESWQSPELRELGQTLDSMANRLAEGRKAELEVAASEARYRLLAANIGDLVTCVDERGLRTFASLSSRDVVGWETEELVGQPGCDLIHPDDCETAGAMMTSLRDGIPVMDVRYRMRHKQGHYIWVGVSGRRAVEGGQIVFTIRDVTGRKKTEDELAQANRRLASLASTDGLTGLLNRRAFDATLDDALAGCLAGGEDLSLLMIDVDVFKLFNDRYGHLAGDEALRAVAAELRMVLRRPGIAVARYGGEEFGVILPRTSLSLALQQAEDLRLAVRRRAIAHAESDFGVVTLSIGATTMSPGGGARTAAEFIERADKALYTAKRNGRDRVEFAVADIAVAS